LNFAVGFGAVLVAVQMFLAGRCLGHPNGEQRHTLIVTAQDNGSSLIRRPGESQIEPLGMESQQAHGPPLPDGRSLPLAGGPQQFSFLFRMLKPGRSTLQLRYWRPWEGAGSIIERFRVQVVIVPAQAAD
jgi:hypothetical protein